MRIVVTAAIVALVTMLTLPAVALAQDEQVGQQGSVWNLGELAPGTYPSTVTAVNQSCPGAHDFHVSVLGEAADFIIITGREVLTDILPGEKDTSTVVFDLRAVAPGVHNEGEIAVRCVDCPFTCSQDYDLLAVHLTVLGDANAAPPDTAADSPWAVIDLTSLDPTMLTPQNGAPGSPPLRWVTADALDRMTSVQDAIGEGLVELEFSGAGHPAGDIFTLTITRNAETPFEMGFALGTLILPDDPAFSPMMVGDDGAVTLLDEVTTVPVHGYSLAPNLRQPLTPDQINGGGVPGWRVAPPPDSGQFGDAVSMINAGYSLAGNLSTTVPLDNYLGTVVQRAIWSTAAPDAFNQERLGRDITAQVNATGGPQSEDEIDEVTEVVWNDIAQVINLGK